MQSFFNLTGSQVKKIYLGCAGWNIPKPLSGYFPSLGTHLERYSKVFNAVEINTTFYRAHRPDTFTRWAEAVPEDFRFAVKLPKEITHIRKLVNFLEPLESFIDQVQHLGNKLGILLIQFPPTLSFSADITDKFFESFRKLYAGEAACEPRHKSWFKSEVEQLLNEYQITRAAVNPAIVPQASRPGGWQKVAYYRLHGSPQMYVSIYSEEELTRLARVLETVATSRPTWCIFNNTARGAATVNALFLRSELGIGNVPNP